MTDALAQARKALEDIAEEAERAQKYYDRYGPTWTTPAGNEYQDTSEHLATCNSLAEKARSALAAIDAALEGGAVPKVRSLEWQKHNVDGTIWDAPSITGGYVVRFDGKEWLTVKNIIVLARSNTCADAKASAQAHLDEKVLSALDLPSPPTGA